MYIKTNGMQIGCEDYRTTADRVLFSLVEPFHGELGESISLCADDGFLMVEHVVSDWLRWEAQRNIVVLTNVPATPPAPELQPDPKAEIELLKEKLTATDYQIIKCSEYQLAGLEAPYDIAVLHARRQALRDEIKLLEVEHEQVH